MYACQGYDAAQAVEKAVTETGSTDADDLVDGLRGAEIPSPRGSFRFNPKTNDPIHDLDIRKVVSANEGVTNDVVETLDGVEGPTWGCDMS